jgi:hypothetical protein
VSRRIALGFTAIRHHTIQHLYLIFMDQLLYTRVFPPWEFGLIPPPLRPANTLCSANTICLSPWVTKYPPARSPPSWIGCSIGLSDLDVADADPTMEAIHDGIILEIPLPFPLIASSSSISYYPPLTTTLFHFHFPTLVSVLYRPMYICPPHFS